MRVVFFNRTNPTKHPRQKQKGNMTAVPDFVRQRHRKNKVSIPTLIEVIKLLKALLRYAGKKTRNNHPVVIYEKKPSGKILNMMVVPDNRHYSVPEHSEKVTSEQYINIWIEGGFEIINISIINIPYGTEGLTRHSVVTILVQTEPE